MKFAVVFQYCKDTAKIQELRPLHRQHLTALKAAGQLVVAGPFLDDSGSLIVYEAASPDEVEKLIEADPFAMNGVFVRHTLRPWNPVMGNRELLPG
jgi:hypothetical protein